jgi:hypothetical protein
MGTRTKTTSSIMRLQFLPVLAIALLLSGCAAPADVPPPADINASMSGISMSSLRIVPQSVAPAGCDKSLYGTLVAMRDGALCVCRHLEKDGPGDRSSWAHIESGKACWPDR